MPYGSVQPYVYAKSRDEAALKRQARAGGLFPKVGKNHEKMLEEQLEGITKAREVTATRARRIAIENRIANQTELERMQSVLAARRIPGLRGELGRQRGTQNVAEQVLYS